MWEYCTKDDVKDFSGLSTESLKDSMSEMTEELIDEHTGNIYSGTTTYTEAHDGDGISDTVILNHSPIASVTSISVDGVALQSADYKVYTSGYIRLVSTAGSALDRATGSVGASFPEGQQNIEVVYVANDSTPPAFVKLAAILCITELAIFSERAGADSSLAVSRASQRAGESAAPYRSAASMAGKLRTIIRNTIGNKWRFE